MYRVCICNALRLFNVSGHEALLQAMSALKRLAVVLMRVADDVRMLCPCICIYVDIKYIESCVYVMLCAY